MKGKQRFEYVPDYVVFDLETTGTDCRNDKVVEISAVKVEDHQVVSEFSTLVNPECSIPAAASNVNGITDDMVADAPLFKDVLPEFIEFIGDLPLVGHNIHTFDLPFIYRDAEQYTEKVPSNDYVDTLPLARMCLPNREKYRLTDLADHFEITVENAHRALGDCRMNQKVYEELGKILESGTVTIKTCPDCGSVMVKRSGQYGPFWGCSGYPNCKHTEKIR